VDGFALHFSRRRREEGDLIASLTARSLIAGWEKLAACWSRVPLIFAVYMFAKY
jgi:hypothetical protein